MSKKHVEIDGTRELKELLHGIVDAIHEIAEDSHGYMIVDGRIGKLKEQTEKIGLVAKRVKIDRCIYKCPFYRSSQDGMECNHPFFEDKGTYDNMIITQDNGRGGKIPPKCPLRKNPLVSRVIYSLQV